MSEQLPEWNELAHDFAAEVILPCNGSTAWAAAMASRRPLRSPEALFAIADEVWRRLPLADWVEAFASHPRIGETHARAASKQSLAWSAGEQSAASPDEAIKRDLAEGNRRYEARFGRVYLVCATGKSAAEMLEILRWRLRNDPETELLEVAEQQRRITQLRLRKWLGLPPATCEGV